MRKSGSVTVRSEFGTGGCVRLPEGFVGTSKSQKSERVVRELTFVGADDQ